MHSQSLGVLALDVAHHVGHIGGEKGASGARITGAGVLVLGRRMMAEFVPGVDNKRATGTPVKVYVDVGQMLAQLVVGQRREIAEPAPEQLFRMGKVV